MGSDCIMSLYLFTFLCPLKACLKTLARYIYKPESPCQGSQCLLVGTPLGKFRESRNLQSGVPIECLLFVFIPVTHLHENSVCNRLCKVTRTKLSTACDDANCMSFVVPVFVTSDLVM